MSDWQKLAAQAGGLILNEFGIQIAPSGGGVGGGISTPRDAGYGVGDDPNAVTTPINDPFADTGPIVAVGPFDGPTNGYPGVSSPFPQSDTHMANMIPGVAAAATWIARVGRTLYSLIVPTALGGLSGEALERFFGSSVKQKGSNLVRYIGKNWAKILGFATTGWLVWDLAGNFLGFFQGRKRRRLDPANTRALTRAMSRIDRFQQLAGKAAAMMAQACGKKKGCC